MLESLQHAEDLSRRYGVCREDILLISLNAMGLSNEATDTNRLRFYARLYGRPEKEFRFILSTDRPLSPFHIYGGELFFKGLPIAQTRDEFDDAAVIGYFRGNKDVITLNSNSRSVCTGCVFCPNTLEGSSDPQIIELAGLVGQLKVLANHNGLIDLSGVKEVNLSTGCFGDEVPAIIHLNLVRRALNSLNSAAQIGILTSVLRSDACFKQIKHEIGDFHLIMTTECFTRRDEILKASKASLTPEMMPGVLKLAKDAGHDTSFTYIVGLDELEVMEHYVSRMAPHVTRMPNFQVYQPHDPIMDQYAATGADRIEYHLEARKKLEAIFESLPVRPKAYANYRPFWYFGFANESLVSEADKYIRLDDGHSPGFKKVRPMVLVNLVPRAAQKW